LKKDYHDQIQQWTREKTDEQLKTMQRPKIYTTLPNVIDHDSNLFVIQKIVQAPFTFDVVFLSEEKNPDVVNNNQIKKASAQAREQFTEKINAHKKEFESKFNNTFHSAEHEFSRDQLEMGAFAISNMVGGIGYFYGTSVHQKHSMVDDSAIGEPYKVSPYELFTGVPARSFFPRGFLWDEGFHELLIQRWNKEISKDIIAHWFNSMREEGWIPREQILGDEAKSRVPEQFQTQHDSHANPPTMFISVLHMARTVLSQISVDETGKQSAFTGADAEYLKTLYPLLRKNYDWYLKTQAGIKAETYRWRGRTPGHTLSSGLDDYPRGTDVPNRDERHLDLHCWVFMMTDTLNRIKQIIDGHGDPTLEKKLDTLRKNLDEYHWNDQLGWYSDYAGKSVNNTRPEYSPHVGYVSLFPLFFVNQQGKNTPKFQQGLKKAYELLHNADGMWSPHGILSLSKMDIEFGTKENYWRGPIWLNINYLALRSLYENREQKVDGVNVGEMYQALRRNLIHTLSTEWHRSRTLYEQYNPITGRGQKAFPFTGWTSLIVLMMGELY
jgi:mannosyl-oligosaccharide glucosidase